MSRIMLTASEARIKSLQDIYVLREIRDLEEEVLLASADGAVQVVVVTTSTMAKNSADVEDKLQKSADSVESARAEMVSAVSDIKKELAGLTNNISDFFKKFEELEKRFAAYENDTAVQKSIGDVDNTSRDTKLQKNLEFDWQGSFLGVHNL